MGSQRTIGNGSIPQQAFCNFSLLLPLKKYVQSISTPFSQHESILIRTYEPQAPCNHSASCQGIPTNNPSGSSLAASPMSRKAPERGRDNKRIKLDISRAPSSTEIKEAATYNRDEKNIESKDLHISGSSFLSLP